MGQRVHLGVDLRMSDRPTRRCTVRELGPDSLLLSRSGAPSGLVPGEEVQLGLRIPPQAEDGYHRLRARVECREESGIVLHIIDAPPAFQRRLRSYLESLAEQAEHERARRREDFEKTAELRAAMRRGAVEQANLLGLLEILLTHAIAELRFKVDTAGSDAERQKWEDDAALLELAWREQSLTHSLCAGLLGPLQPAPPETETGNAAGEACLMDDAHSDRWLVRTAMVDALNVRLADRLADLRERLVPLVGHEGKLPMSPEAIADVLDQTLEQLELSPDGRLFVLKASEDCLGRSLPVFYDRLLNAG